jgi:SAM-dependent methyltransferase
MTDCSGSAYKFLIGAISKLSENDASPRILDFGCGTAKLVAMGAETNLDIWGADNFSYNKEWQAEADAAVGAKVVNIQDGVLPFPDRHFDIVIANMVFEHVPDPSASLPEIARVLKPNGRFLALFPTYETWFEGHLGLYFPHWLSAYPRLQARYLTTLYNLGFGYWRRDTTEEWVSHRQKQMGTTVIYHRERDVHAWWRNVFGEDPEDLSAYYMRSRMPVLARLPDWLLRAICRRRVGLVLLARKG